MKTFARREGAPPRSTATGLRRSRVLLTVVFGGWFGIVGCASRVVVPDDFLAKDRAEARSRPLGGESLAQHKLALERAQRDMVHFYETLDTLRHRKDRNGYVLFREFCDAYLGTHLASLLETTWQSDHPELTGVDANLRVMQAAVLLQMREPGRAQEVIEGIRERFQGQESILVDYPLGKRTPLAEALELLDESKWRG